MEIFKSYITKAQPINEANHRVGIIKLPSYAKQFLDGLESSVMDPAEVVAEVIGLYANTPQAGGDFFDELSDAFAKRKIKI